MAPHPHPASDKAGPVRRGIPFCSLRYLLLRKRLTFEIILLPLSDTVHTQTGEPVKKTFEMTHPKVKPVRLAEQAKRDINRYVRRERKRELPEGVDFWDFDCKFGQSEEDAKPIHLAEFGKHIDEALSMQLPAFYVELIAIPGRRAKKKPRGEKTDS